MTQKRGIFNDYTISRNGSISSKFVGEEKIEKYPKVEIITPEGRLFDWGAEELTKELESKSNRKISPIIYSPTMYQ